MKKALGMVEIVGLSTAIFVADIMIKTANVEIIEIENTKGLGYMTVKVVGDVGAVNAAVSAGKNEAMSYGNYVSSVVIARPHDEMYYTMIEDKEEDTKVQEEIVEEKVQEEIKEEIKEDNVEVLDVEQIPFEDEKEEIIEENADVIDDEDTVESSNEEEILEEVEKDDTKKSKSAKKMKGNKKK